MAITNRVMTYENLEHRVYEALAHNNLESLKEYLATQHPANIAAVLDRLNHPHRHQVFALLAPAQQAKVLDELSTEATQNVLDILSPQEVGVLLNYMPMDEAARLLAEEVPKQRAELLEVMSPEHAAAVQTLLQYPPESAGRMMTEKFARVQPELTAAETLAYLRQINPEVETLTDLYVLNPAGQLIGVVSLRDVVVAAPERCIDELMNTELVTVAPDTDREEVARLVSHYDYLAMPVVTPDKHMLGIIPVDDVIDALVAEQTEDIMKFGGMEGGGISNQPYVTVPLPMVIRKRVGWLFLLFVAETFTGTVLRHFEDELAKVVALSFFIPLLIGTGGNTGAQTVSTLIRGLALGEIRLRDTWRVIARELAGGLLLGLILGTVAFGRALLWGSTSPLALTVGVSILAICTWANAVG